MTALIGKIPVEKFRSVYLTALLICLCVRNIGIYAFAPSVIDSAVFSVLAAVGFFIFILQIIRKDIDFHLTDNLLLALFLAALILSSAISFRYGIFQNAKECVWTVISFFVVGFCYCGEDNFSVMRKVLRVQNIIIIFWFMMSLASIFTALLQIGHVFHVRENSWVGVGITENRLFGVFVNPNSASIVAIMAILFSIFQIYYSPKGSLGRKFNIANIMVQFIYISLSESRGSYMVCLFLGFVLAFLFSCNLFDLKGFYKILVPFCMAAVFTLALFFTMNLITKLFSVIPSLGRDIAVLSRYGCSSPIGKRSDYVNNNDVSNLRFKIWLSAWDIFKKNLLFGVTPGNITDYAKSVMPETFMAVRGYKRAHSVWFGIPLYTGILGTFCMFGFFLKKTVDFYESYKRIGVKRSAPILNLCALVFISVLVYGLVESEILFVNSVCSFIFWFFVGVSANYMNYGTKGAKS